MSPPTWFGVAAFLTSRPDTRPHFTVIRFVWLVLNLEHASLWVKMEQLLKLKCVHSPLNLRILSSTNVPYTFTTVQVPNLALTHTKRITVCRGITYKYSIQTKYTFYNVCLQYGVFVVYSDNEYDLGGSNQSSVKPTINQPNHPLASLPDHTLSLSYPFSLSFFLCGVLL